MLYLLGKENEALNNDKHPFTDVRDGLISLWVMLMKRADKRYPPPSLVQHSLRANVSYLCSSCTGPLMARQWFHIGRMEGCTRCWYPAGDVFWKISVVDMVLISEAALFARLNDSDITLLDKLIEDGAVQKPDHEVTQPGNVAVIDSLDKASGVLTEGSICQLMIKDANGADITWSTSNSDIVFVDHSGEMEQTGSAMQQ